MVNIIKQEIEIKEYYDNQDFNSNDVYEIAENTTKEDDLFDYADVPNFLKSYGKDKTILK